MQKGKVVYHTVAVIQERVRVDSRRIIGKPKGKYESDQGQEYVANSRG